jgi:hypothetical protein
LEWGSPEILQTVILPRGVYVQVAGRIIHNATPVPKRAFFLYGVDGVKLDLAAQLVKDCDILLQWITDGVEVGSESEQAEGDDGALDSPPPGRGGADAEGQPSGGGDALPTPAAGEEYVPFAKRVAASQGITFFAAKSLIKQQKLWTPPPRQRGPKRQRPADTAPADAAPAAASAASSASAASGAERKTAAATLLRRLLSGGRIVNDEEALTADRIADNIRQIRSRSGSTQELEQQAVVVREAKARWRTESSAQFLAVQEETAARYKREFSAATASVCRAMNRAGDAFHGMVGLQRQCLAREDAASGDPVALVVQSRCLSRPFCDVCP